MAALCLDDIQWAINLIRLAQTEKNTTLLTKFTAAPRRDFAQDISRLFWIRLLQQRYFDKWLPPQLLQHFKNSEALTFLINFAYHNCPQAHTPLSGALVQKKKPNPQASCFVCIDLRGCPFLSRLNGNICDFPNCKTPVCSDCQVSFNRKCKVHRS